MEILGIGSDIVECVRIGRMIDQYGEAFLQRVYTDREIGYCQTRKRAIEHFAGRWAAKEAILKALGTGWSRGIGWTDIEVRNRDDGRPVVHVRGAARDLVARRGIADLLLTISHSRMYATAFAMAVAPQSPPLALGFLGEGS